MPGRSLERLLGPAASEKLTALAFNRDPREIKMHRPLALGGRPIGDRQEAAEERIFRPTLAHLADRIGARLRAKSLAGRTVTVRVRFADLHAVTRALTLDAPIAATASLAEIAEELVRAALAHHADEKYISLLAISVSHLEKDPELQLELSLGLANDARRPGTRRGLARHAADGHRRDPRSLRMGRDRIRPVALGGFSSVPDEFRELAEKDL